MDAQQRREEGRRLGRLIEEAGWSQRRFAAEMGLSPSVMNNLIQGRTQLSRERLGQAARLLGVGDEVLRPALDRRRAQAVANLAEVVPIARSGHRMVPIFGAITAGMPAHTPADAVEWEEMPEWGGDFERWGRVITGDSMVDEFEEGDIAVFENRRHEPGHGVHAYCNGEDTFKIFRLVDGMPQLWPINPAYEPIPVLMADGQLNWKVKGVCIRRIRRLSRGVRDIREYPHGLMWRFR